ncbi:MAG: pilus assembly protein N-terminal domain-containing protein [Planctomycetaceae bacterium]|nr:pilus assembly protein N-terminal domain-containing protein [Planctomycetaceae bacterium]
MAPELLAQTAERGQALPRPLPPGPGEERDPQLLSLGDGLQESVSPELPRLKLSEPRPASGSRSVPAFVDSLKGNDAAFEVLVGQGRILTVKEDLTAGPNQPLIAAGDPSVIEFSVMNLRQIRVTGLRVGVTDLSISTGKNQVYSFEVRVLADLSLLQGRLHAFFPDASIKLGQLRDHIVVEGEARDNAQVARIIETVASYLRSVQVGQQRQVMGQPGRGSSLPTPTGGGAVPGQANPPGEPTPVEPGAVGIALPEMGGPIQVTAAITPTNIINLLRVPGSQQVMLKVRIAELNRTALRTIGSNFLGVDPKTGAIVGSQIASPVSAAGQVGVNPPLGSHLFGSATAPIEGLSSTGGTTVFGIFRDGNFMFTLNALRTNGLLKILAEPNLVAFNGQKASFLAGGEYPVPVPQVSAAGVAPTVTVQFKEFGVRLGFVPYILDGDRIRLTVAPEVSNIDFSIAVTLVAGGSPVPGLDTRKALTTVELEQGQTLAIAGLLQLQLNGTTNRIPGLGDLPIIGEFFSNTTSSRTELELVVLVTPYLIEPMHHDQVPPTPGDEVKEPNDLELFFLNRIESRTGKDFRATTKWDDVFHLRDLLKLERKYVQGPVGFSE